MRSRLLVASSLLLASTLGCSAPPGTHPDAGPAQDSGSEAGDSGSAVDSGAIDPRAVWEADADAGCLDTGVPGVVSMSLLQETSTASAFKVTYLSDGLTVLGELCIPKSPGPHPIAVFNHGGLSGMDNQWGLGTSSAPTTCGTLANAGFVGVLAQYRGEGDSYGTSGGGIELCNGEVTDVLELLRIARRRCDVDRNRIVVWGISHGGCISLKVAATGPKLKAVAAYVAPIDFPSVIHHTEDSADAGNAGAQALLDAIIPVLGTPESNPVAYEARAVLPLAKDIVGTPVFLVYSGNDELIPVDNGCRIRAAIADGGIDFRSYHLALDGTVLDAGDPRCPGLSFEVPTTAPAMDGGAYFLLLKDQSHVGAVQPTTSYQEANAAVSQFLGWHVAH